MLHPLFSKHSNIMTSTFIVPNLRGQTLPQAVLQRFKNLKIFKNLETELTLALIFLKPNEQRT